MVILGSAAGLALALLVALFADAGATHTSGGTAAGQAVYTWTTGLSFWQWCLQNACGL